MNVSNDKKPKLSIVTFAHGTLSSIFVS